MKKPCPVPVFVQVMPVVALTHLKDPSTLSEPYASFGALGSIAVSPAQTNWPAPEPDTSRPWPKSTSFEQLDGCGGGDQSRWLMSQRAVPSSTTQPTFRDGDSNVVRWTTATGAAADVVDVATELVAAVVEVVADAAVVEDTDVEPLLPDAVIVTVVVPPLDPHPASPTASANAIPANAPVALFTNDSLYTDKPTGRF
jgi:hypothetical protein